MAQGKVVRSNAAVRAKNAPYTKRSAKREAKKGVGKAPKRGIRAHSKRPNSNKEVTKLINSNIESIVASRAMQDSGRFTLRDIKEKGDTQLRVAKEMERKKSKKAKVERQKEELERKLREMRGE